MIEHTAAQLAQLKGKTRIVYLIEFQTGDSTHRLTNGDKAILSAQDYQPGFVDDIDDIEITSEPKMNDIRIILNDEERFFTTTFLSETWMNKPLSIIKRIMTEDGTVILDKIAFEGLLSDIAIDTQASKVNLTVSSIWADYEKTSGIKTNSASQQRFYPNDTAFDHAASATLKVYWGKDAPSTPGVGGGGGGFPDPVRLQ